MEDTQHSFIHDIMEINHLLNTAKETRHIFQYAVIMNQISQAIRGVYIKFICNADFYGDLKETLVKIKRHLKHVNKRTLISKILMMKRDAEELKRLQIHVDNLCGNILYCYAQQRQTLNQKLKS